MAKYLFINGSRHGKIFDEDYDSNRRTMVLFGKPTVGSVGPNGRNEIKGTPNEHYELELFRMSDGKNYLIGSTGNFSLSDLETLIKSSGHKPLE